MSSSERIVICGAGIAGVAAAHALAVSHGRQNVTIVEPGLPLSLTSDKSTEAYRNWWPGPDRAMTAFMNRSIDLIEGIARATDNRINLNRRGYVFATADTAKIPFLKEMARSAEVRGGGPARLHETASSDYLPSPERGFEFPLTGADVITDVTLIRRHFPYLAEETVALVHARRAGWLSAQQLGAAMLEAARAAGVTLVKGRVTGIDAPAGRVRAVQVESDGGRQALEASHVVLAAGPMQKEVARLLGVDLPVYAECHHKVSFHDPLGVVPQHAPMLIWLDEQHLPWSDEEAAVLRDDAEAAWLLKKFPAGVHGRPDGSTLLALFNHHGEAVEPVFPLPEEPHYEEIALRGMSTMLPALRAYQGQPARAFVDGGYYIRTKENRPLIGPLPGVEGAYISCAYSGFGVMASCAGGDLVARHVIGAALPDYAPAFTLSRYQDPSYAALLATWGEDGQL